MSADKGTCSVLGCERPVCARGLCPCHYGRKLRWGDVRADVPIREIVRNRRCSAEGCDKAAMGKGLCPGHYRRLRMYGEVRAEVALRVCAPGPSRCTVASCDRAAVARGLCFPHYQRFRRHGDPLADIPLGGMPYGLVSSQGARPSSQ